jgi:hypothetical protein
MPIPLNSELKPEKILDGSGTEIARLPCAFVSALRSPLLALPFVNWAATRLAFVSESKVCDTADGTDSEATN